MRARAKIQTQGCLITKVHGFFFSLCKMILKSLQREVTRPLQHKGLGNTLQNKLTSVQYLLFIYLFWTAHLNHRKTRLGFVYITTLCRGRVSLRKHFYSGGGWLEISSEQLFREELLEFIFNYTPE